MDTIWIIMYGIVCIFELFGFAMLAITAILMVINPGHIKWIDSIRNYILMLDEEDFK